MLGERAGKRAGSCLRKQQLGWFESRAERGRVETGKKILIALSLGKMACLLLQHEGGGGGLGADRSAAPAVTEITLQEACWVASTPWNEQKFSAGSRGRESSCLLLACSHFPPAVGPAAC